MLFLLTVLKTTRTEQCTQEEARGDLSCACPVAVPSLTYLLQRSVWEEIWQGRICLPGVERRCHVGLTPASSAIARRQPSGLPQTLKMCPPECKAAKKRLQRVSECPGQTNLSFSFQPQSSSLLLSPRDRALLRDMSSVGGKAGDRHSSGQVSHTSNVTCLGCASFSFPRWLGKEKGLQSLAAERNSAGSSCDFFPVRADVLLLYVVRSMCPGHRVIIALFACVCVCFM